jgi:hypothetical protein
MQGDTRFAGEHSEALAVAGASTGADRGGGQMAEILVVPVGGTEAVLSQALVEAVSGRMRAGAATFHVVVPDPAPHAELTSGQRRSSHERGEVLLRRAVARLSHATAVGAITGAVSIRHDPMDVVEEAVRERRVDEIILAIARHPVRQRLHVDLPHRLAHLGIPVTTVTL